MKQKWLTIVCFVACAGLMVLAVKLDGMFLLLSFAMIAVCALPFLVRFEGRQVQTEEVVLVGVLAAVAAVSRVPFGAIPSVQPTSFVIMASALVLGGESGFMIGAVAAVASNLFLGQGPWTPWQMFLWGMMGYVTGLLRDTWLLRRKIPQMIYAFAWGLVFGWMMNLWYLAELDGASFGVGFIASCITSFPMDAAHGVCNVLLMAVCGGTWQKILGRAAYKYGLAAPPKDNRTVKKL